jgi:CO/xanthine dehydrogenase Mo-binding subunit
MFVDDFDAADAYFAVIIRSPVAIGKIKSVKCPPLISSGYTLITEKDIPGENKLFNTDMPILAKDRVTYIGQPVALLVGPNKNRLNEYKLSCSVDIENDGEPDFSITDSKTIFSKKISESGNIPKTSGDIAIEGRYETGVQEHWYSEPHGALVKISNDKKSFIIKCATQDETWLKNSATAVLDIKAEQVTLENLDLGIHFDGKIWYPALIGSLAALASFVTKESIKLKLDREEDYLFSPKRTPSDMSIRSTVNSDGQVIETEIDVKIGFGAYAVLSEKMVETIIRSLSGMYKLGKLKITVSAMINNNPPMGPFAGFGSSLVFFGLERHISKICDTLDEEGSGWRASHLQGKLKIGTFLDSICKDSEYKRKWAAYELLRHKSDKDPVLPQRGIGLSIAFSEKEGENSPLAAAVVEVEIDKVNYEAKVRGVWFYTSIGHVKDRRKAEQNIRISICAALGWTFTEKIRLVDGSITPELCALYQFLTVSETPPIYIGFSDENDEDEISDLPFSVVPQAYTQAVSQAVDYHLGRIPITGLDVWRVINIRKLEAEKAEKVTKEDVAEDAEK